MEDWTVNKALRNAEKEMDALNIPSFNMDLTPREDLDFSNLLIFHWFQKPFGPPDLFRIRGIFQAYFHNGF